MTVLAVLVLIVARIFTDSAQAMRTGTRNADVNASARAVLDYISREVSLALFDASADGRPVLMLRTVPPAASNPTPPPAAVGYLGRTLSANRELHFVTVATGTNDARETKFVAYGLNQAPPGSYRFQLMRGEMGFNTNDHNWYANWAAAASRVSRNMVMLQNVRSFGATYSEFWEQADPQATRSGDTSTNFLAYLDLHLEVMDEADAIRAAELWKAGAPQRALDYTEQKVKRYSERVYFHNRNGYYKAGR
jgi:hypothetical protein